MIRIRCKRAILTTEYACLFIAVGTAVVIMATYLKRSIAGNIRKSADAIGEQYAPREVDSNMTTTTSSESISHTVTGRKVINGKNLVTADTTTVIPEDNPQVTLTEGTETVGPLKKDLWD